jgi:hypothetical protein
VNVRDKEQDLEHYHEHKHSTTFMMKPTLAVSNAITLSYDDRTLMFASLRRFVTKTLMSATLGVSRLPLDSILTLRLLRTFLTATFGLETITKTGNQLHTNSDLGNAVRFPALRRRQNTDVQVLKNVLKNDIEANDVT